MVLTVTLNPSVDKTYIVEKFTPGFVNYAHETVTNAGSKGINVSRVVRLLGQDTLALSFYGGKSGAIFAEKLAEEGIRCDLIEAENFTTRVNVKIMEVSTRSLTDLNELGSPVSDYDYNKFVEKFRAHLPQSKIVVMSGKLLPKMMSTVYYDLVKIAHEFGKTVILDCGGEVLREGIKAAPYMIKPNQYEFETMLGKSGLSQEEIVLESKNIIEKFGIKYVVVTLGSEGALGISQAGALKIIPPNVDVFSTVGAGDAFLAGICHALISGMDFSKQLVLGTSCASAKVTKKGNEIPSLVELFGYANGCRIVSI